MAKYNKGNKEFPYINNRSDPINSSIKSLQQDGILKEVDLNFFLVLKKPSIYQNHIKNQSKKALKWKSSESFLCPLVTRSISIFADTDDSSKYSLFSKKNTDNSSLDSNYTKKIVWKKHKKDTDADGDLAYALSNAH